MKKNSNEVIVEQTVTLDDLPPLPPVTIRHGAIDVDLDQIHDGIRETVSIEFDSLQQVIDILTKMLHQHDWEDWNRLVGGDQKPGTGTPPPLP